MTHWAIFFAVVCILIVGVVMKPPTISDVRDIFGLQLTRDALPAALIVFPCFAALVAIICLA